MQAGRCAQHVFKLVPKIVVKHLHKIVVKLLRIFAPLLAMYFNTFLGFGNWQLPGFLKVSAIVHNGQRTSTYCSQDHLLRTMTEDPSFVVEKDRSNFVLPSSTPKHLEKGVFWDGKKEITPEEARYELGVVSYPGTGKYTNCLYVQFHELPDLEEHPICYCWRWSLWCAWCFLRAATVTIIALTRLLNSISSSTLRNHCVLHRILKRKY